jgi:DNA adenine methylase
MIAATAEDEVRESATHSSAKPFVKWAGGKRLVLPKLLPHMPPVQPGRRYIEGFLGGGAMFFALQPERGLLADLNGELIDVFRAVRDQVDLVIKALRPLRNDEATYYAVRASRPRNAATKAARFIYLNKTCFNGLYRVNTRGEFNVPFGRHGQQLLVCDENQLLAASRALAGTDLAAADFGATVRRSRPGDLVYLDPPYTTAHANNGFIEYNQRVFSWADQRRLARVTINLVKRGVDVVVSNADHPAITALYTDACFEIHRIARASTMAGNPEHRFGATELLIVGHASREG